MSTQRFTQLLHPDHKYLNEFILIVLVIVGSSLIALIPLIDSSNLIDTKRDSFIIPMEAEFWNSLG